MVKKSNNKAKRIAKRNKSQQKGGGGGVKVKFAEQMSTGRVTIKSLMNHPIFGGKMTSNVLTIPAAFVNILGNSTYFGENGRVMMPELGIDPVNIIGCQPLSDVTGAVATPDVFTNLTLATTSGANTIGLSPDVFNGPLAARANLYDKYVFRDVLIEYVSTCATSQASAVAVAIEEDGGGGGAPTTFSTTRQIVPSVAFPFRADRAFLHYHYRGPQLFWTTDAADRLTRQGAIYAFASANITVISPGFFNVYYSIDLYNPVLTQGFTVSIRRDERDEIRNFLEFVRKLPDSQKAAAMRDLSRITAPAYEEPRAPPGGAAMPRAR